MTVLSKDAPAEISGHPAHPEHKLKLLVASGGDAEFRCNGCNEHGSGGRYRCEPCNFDLHKDCALAEATLLHPLLEGCKFKLRRKPPGAGKDERLLCDACGTGVLGWYYHCDKKGGLDLHPCCAKLPMEIKHEKFTFELREEASHRCSSCGGRGGVGTFWFYRSTCKTVYLHVGCVKKEMIARRSHAAGGGSSCDDMIPFVRETVLKGKGYRGERAGSNLERICKMVAAVVRIIVAVIIGDPTPIIAAVVVGLVSNSTG